MNVIGIDDLTVTIGTLVFVSGLIVTLWQAIKAIREMTQPAKNLALRVDAIEEHLANDKRRLDEQEEGQKLLLRGMLVLVDHGTSEDDKHTGDLALLKNDISTYLINR